MGPWGAKVSSQVGHRVISRCAGFSDPTGGGVGVSMRTTPLLLAVFAVGCAEPLAPPSAPPPQDQHTGAAVTFHRDVEPILQRSCDGCHIPGGIAPFALTHYKSAAE